MALLEPDAPEQAPKAGRRRRTGLMVAIIGLCVLLVGMLAVAGLIVMQATGLFDPSSRPRVNPPPWSKNALITPQATTDPRIRSVVRAQQYRQAWRIAADDPGQQVSLKYSFDPDQRRGERPPVRLPSMVAGLDVYLRTDSDAGPDDISLTEYDSPADATAEAAKVNARYGGQSMTAPRLTGADRVVLLRMQSRSTPCQPPEGDPAGLALIAVVDDHVTVVVTDGCLGSTEIVDGTAALTKRAAEVVTVVRQVRSQPVPVRWMDQTAGLPIISDGSWSAEQVPIGRLDSSAVDRLLPAPFTRTHVQTAFFAKDDVYVYADDQAAHAVMADLPTLDSSGRYLEPPKPADPSEGAERMCATGMHLQLGVTCWSRVGRFIVVGVHPSSGPDASLDERQVKALRGVT